MFLARIFLQVLVLSAFLLISTACQKQQTNLDPSLIPQNMTYNYVSTNSAGQQIYRQWRISRNNKGNILFRDATGDYQTPISLTGNSYILNSRTLRPVEAVKSPKLYLFNNNSVTISPELQPDEREAFHTIKKYVKEDLIEKQFQEPFYLSDSLFLLLMAWKDMAPGHEISFKAGSGSVDNFYLADYKIKCLKEEQKTFNNKTYNTYHVQAEVLSSTTASKGTINVWYDMNSPHKVVMFYQKVGNNVQTYNIME